VTSLRPTSIVSLCEEADASGRISHRTFERALVLGPAVLALQNNVSFLTGSFAGHPDAMFIEVPEGKWVQGVIILEDVTFRDCRFENIGIIGTREQIEQIRSGIAGIGDVPPLTPPAPPPQAEQAPEGPGTLAPPQPEPPSS